MNFEDLPAIPREFCNSETGKPFTHCLVCQTDLMQETRPYSVERAIRNYPEMQLTNVVFEYALCATCTANMENDISTKTKEAIMDYFKQQFNYQARPKWNGYEEEEEVEFDCNQWIDKCAIKGLPKSELFEYSLYARCIGDRIIPDVVPYMISGIAQDDLIELFSNKSLGFLDDFTDKYFTGPPELKALFKGRPILV
ncbi:hypothetical protein ACFLR1_04640 [Bacteroidota bacterium]